MAIGKLPSAPTPKNFADAHVEEVAKPAVERVAADDGAVAVDTLATPTDGFESLGNTSLSALGAAGSVDGQKLLDDAWQRAHDAAATAAGNDGRLSKADAAALPVDLRMSFHFLRDGDLPAVDTPAPEPTPDTTTDGATGVDTPSTTAVDLSKVRYSENVINDVMTTYGLTDRNALLTEALKLDDGNLYLKRTELEAAANALRQSVPEGIDYAESVITDVMADHQISNRALLLNVATAWDLDGNRYLKRSELEAAAKVLDGTARELGIVSDIDKTILPPDGMEHGKPPYAGLTTLLHELESGMAANFGAREGKAGDFRKVTARSPSSTVGIDAWMASHGVPDGPLEAGNEPFNYHTATPEKIKDISKIFDDNPDQHFVLFGDTSFTDRLVYAEIKKKYGDRVRSIFMHDVKAAPANELVGMHLIDNYAEAAVHLMNDGLISKDAARKVMVAAQHEGLAITDAEIEAALQ